jgi:hypothetical protein
MVGRLRVQSKPTAIRSAVYGCHSWQYTESTTLPFPRVVGAGEVKSSTPIPPAPPPWYRQPQFIRNCINIMLLALFFNSAVMILSYKSQKKEVMWRSKERIQTL